jgi:cytochrome bd-type quinol oxidase subunit 2
VPVFRRLDLLALSASVMAAAVTVLWLYLVATENDTPAWWALAVLLVGIAGAGYAVRPDVPYRRVALVASAVCLISLGYLALLSIGLPLLLAGAFCVAAALRARPAKDWRDMV